MAALAGYFEKAPGYMDADYYYGGGLAISKGAGFYLPVVWNYLDDPGSIPYPSHTYWMPLPSLLAVAGLLIGPGFSFARLPFWLLWGCVPPVTVFMGLRLHGDPGRACLGGLFALFPVFYLPFISVPDSFAIYMLLGSGVLLVLSSRWQAEVRFLLAGLLTGLMHLSRADGILWAGFVLVWAAWTGWRTKGSRLERALWAVALSLGVLGGYFIPMTVWYARNLAVWGLPFPPGGSRALWLTQYEDTFLYPAAQLTPLRWLAQGLGAIFLARWQALGANIQTWVAVQGSTALFPFMLVGLWQMRKLLAVRLGGWIWLATFGLMSFVFPFAGSNGSFFHAGAAFQPLLWAAAPLGIEKGVDWLSRMRHWQRGSTVRRFLQIVLLGACVLVSAVLYLQRVVGSGAEGATWNSGFAGFQAVEARLVEFGATPCLTVMVNNPPGYYSATGRSAVVIPFGDQETLLAVARRFKVSYLVLDENNAWYLPALYAQPADMPGLRYLGRWNNSRIYAFALP